MELERAAGALERHLAGQLAAALARPEEAATRTALAAAGEVWRQIAPRDALEQLLAVQMIAGHEAALDGYARARQAGAAADAAREAAAAPEALADSERARRAELRLAARLSSLFARQAALLTRRREAAARRAERAQKEARRQAADQARQAAARAPAQGGVLVVPHEAAAEGAPARPWPDPDAVAAALARKQAASEAQAEASAAPGPPAGAPKGPGYLIVPGTTSPEEWTRRVREHDRRLKASG